MSLEGFSNINNSMTLWFCVVAVCEMLVFVKLLVSSSTLGEELHMAKNHLANSPWVGAHVLMARTTWPFIPTKNWELSHSLTFQV